MIERTKLERALEPLAQMLGADGYELSAKAEGRRVVLEVSATPDACEDCLVPAGVISTMAAGYLSADPRSGAKPEIEVRLPADH